MSDETYYPAPPTGEDFNKWITATPLLDESMFEERRKSFSKLLSDAGGLSTRAALVAKWNRSISFARKSVRHQPPFFKELCSAFPQVRVFTLAPSVLEAALHTDPPPIPPRLPFRAILFNHVYSATFSGKDICFAGELFIGNPSNLQTEIAATLLLESGRSPLGALQAGRIQDWSGEKTFWGPILSIMETPFIEYVDRRALSGEPTSAPKVKGRRMDRTEDLVVDLTLSAKRYIYGESGRPAGAAITPHWVRGHWRHLTAERFTKEWTWVMPFIRGRGGGSPLRKDYNVRGSR